MKESSVIRNGVIYQTQKVLSQKCQAFLWTKSVAIWNFFFFFLNSSKLHPVPSWYVCPLSGRKLFRVISRMPSQTSERHQWSWWIVPKILVGCKCALKDDIQGTSLMHFLGRCYYWFSGNILHPAMTTVILENKANQYKLYISKLELWSPCQ